MSARVATTQWSQVLAARDGSDTEAHRALENLCQTYWQPLYAYIRHQGSSPEEARDLTQGYFAELLEKDISRHGLIDVDQAKRQGSVPKKTEGLVTSPHTSCSS